MTVLEVFTFAVKPERLDETKTRLRAFEVWCKRRPDLWGSMKSYHVYTKLDKASSVPCLEVCEFDSLADVEKNYEAVKQDREYQTVHLPAFTDVIIPGTLGREIWSGML